jgi:hypothetical protein
MYIRVIAGTTDLLSGAPPAFVIGLIPGTTVLILLSFWPGMFL